MKVILLENNKKLGKFGQEINVKSGYARNYLIPNKKAVYSNKESANILQQAKLEADKLLNQAQDIKTKLESSKITVFVKTNENDQLFGSISSVNILNELKNLNLDYKFAKKDIIMPKEKISTLGDFQIQINLHQEVIANIILEIKQQ